LRRCWRATITIHCSNQQENVVGKKSPEESYASSDYIDGLEGQEEIIDEEIEEVNNYWRIK
jgi:hypothetical protein